MKTPAEELEELKTQMREWVQLLEKLVGVCLDSVPNSADRDFAKVYNPENKRTENWTVRDLAQAIEDISFDMETKI